MGSLGDKGYGRGFTHAECSRGGHAAKRVGAQSKGGVKLAKLPGWMAYLARQSNAKRVFDRAEMARRGRLGAAKRWGTRC